MLRFVALVCLIGSSLALPTRSRDEIDSFRRFLLETKSEDASTFEENMKKFPWNSAWENSGKYQGDIVLTDEDMEDMVAAFAGEESTARNGIQNSARLWPNRNIIFQFAGHNANNQNAIRGVMTMYHDRTCVRFSQRTNQQDFVRITDQNNGCYAHVGYYRGFGAHTHNLAPNGCMHPSIIFHEFGHNVGFNHMHQAQVRNNWVTINLNNVQSGMEHNFNLLPNQYSNMLGLPYEYASNQHYGPTAFSRNGQPTIVARQAGGHEMGQLSRITNWDYQRINRLYNCPGAWDTPVRMEDANTFVEWPSMEELIERGARFAAEEEERIRMESMMPEEIVA